MPLDVGQCLAAYGSDTASLSLPGEMRSCCGVPAFVRELSISCHCIIGRKSSAK